MDVVFSSDYLLVPRWDLLDVLADLVRRDLLESWDWESDKLFRWLLDAADVLSRYWVLDEFAPHGTEKDVV